VDNLAQLRWWILGVLIAVALASSLVAVLSGSRWQDALLNFGTEMAGAVVTYGLFELIIERRERREAEKEAVEARKAELIAQMGSDVRDVAVPAADELRRQGWLTDGSLRGAILSYANLQEANLSVANLRGSVLKDANLQEAKLQRANLEGAILSYANLKGAYLERTNLKGAKPWHANLQGAYLEGANLEGAILAYANLQGAYLERADLEGATLGMANLNRATLSHVNLERAFLGYVHLGGANLKAAKVTAEQLAQATTLAGATLPDGTKLSEDNWEAEFEEWRKKQEE
jgi:uncharacterized protein YjbI with pentapeptide repeats